jgi:hypothetical protein
MKQLVAIIFVLIFFGCGGSNETQTPKGKVSAEPVQTSGSKPDWVSSDVENLPVEEGRIRFRVMTDNEQDIGFLSQMGLRSPAYAAMIEKIKIKAGLEFDDAGKISNYNKESAGHARQAVVNAIGKVEFSDLVKERQYWEKYEKNEGNNTVSYFYRIYAIMSISEQEYQRAKEAAWNEAKQYVERQQDKEAKQILDEAKARFLSK